MLYASHLCINYYDMELDGLRPPKAAENLPMLVGCVIDIPAARRCEMTLEHMLSRAALTECVKQTRHNNLEHLKEPA